MITFLWPGGMTVIIITVYCHNRVKFTHLSTGHLIVVTIDHSRLPIIIMEKNAVTNILYVIDMILNLYHVQLGGGGEMTITLV